VYDLNYTTTTWGRAVQSWREITSGDTRTEKVEYRWARGHNESLPFVQYICVWISFPILWDLKVHHAEVKCCLCLLLYLNHIIEKGKESRAELDT
jgi:hypothetical protein